MKKLSHKILVSLLMMATYSFSYSKKAEWHFAIPPTCQCNLGLSPADYFGRTMVENLPGIITVGIITVSVAGSDKQFHWAKAIIEDNEVVVYSDEVSQPVVVRYSWADNPECNLVNPEGLPAVPFRTDDWKGIIQK